MNRAEIIAKLRAIEPQLRAQGVAVLYLFGSYARDEARADSDVDMFVDPVDDNTFGLIPLFSSRAVVESTLPGMDIAYSTRASIVPGYRLYIERDAIRVF
jgi:predicted nucleotidyltransferase